MTIMSIIYININYKSYVAFSYAKKEINYFLL
jgi:hypothetical protein